MSGIGPDLEQSLAEELYRLGLTRDEIRCYLALLLSHRLTARELVAATGITRGRIYDVINGLVAKGVATENVARVRSVIAVPPRIAVANLLEKRRREVRELEDSTREIVAKLSAVASGPNAPPSVLEVVRHAATVRERCHEFEDAARAEILFYIRNVRQVSGDLIQERRALGRGVRIRALYESSLLETEYGETIQRFVDAGGEGRHVKRLPMQLVVYDGSITMLPLQEPPLAATPLTVLVINHAGVSTLAVSAFERVWEKAKAVPFERPRRRAGSA